MDMHITHVRNRSILNTLSAPVMDAERQREGIAKAKSGGRYQGRPATAKAKTDEIKALKAQGLSMAKIAAELGVGVGLVHRALSSKQAE